MCIDHLLCVSQSGSFWACSCLRTPERLSSSNDSLSSTNHQCHLLHKIWRFIKYAYFITCFIKYPYFMDDFIKNENGCHFFQCHILWIINNETNWHPRWLPHHKFCIRFKIWLHILYKMCVQPIKHF
jgi:hypothetical protein